MPLEQIPKPHQYTLETGTAQNMGWVHAKDLHLPNIDSKYYARFGENELAQIVGLFKEIGRYNPVANVEYSHYEKPRDFTSFQVAAAVASPGAGAAAVYTIKADNHGGAGSVSRPQKQELIYFPDGTVGQITAKNTTVANAHTITVAPLRAADALPAVVVDQYLVLMSNAYGEGTYHPEDVLDEDPYKWVGQTHILKRTYMLTGSEMNSVSRVNIPEGSKLAKILGGGGRKWWRRGDHLTYVNFMKDIFLTLFASRQADNPLITGQAAPYEFHTTEGLIPQIKDGGINPADYTAGAMTIFDFQALTNELDVQNGAKEYCFFSGNQALHEKDNILTDTFKQGAIQYHAFGGSGMGQERAVRYGFDSFRVGDYTFHWKKFALFHHPELLGAPGYDYSGDYFGIPMDQKADAKNKSASVPSISVKYRAGGSGSHEYINEAGAMNREMSVTYTGGQTGQTFVSDTWDGARVHYQAEIGLETYGINRFIYQSRA